MTAEPTTSGATDEQIPFLVLGLACFASSISVRAIDPMLPIVAGQFGVTLHHAAWLVTAFGIPFAFAPLFLGPLADTIGKAIVVKVCCALLTLGFAACALAPTFDALIVARGFSGVVAGAIVPVTFALIGDRIAFARRQVWISRLVVAGITGQMGGAALAGVMAHYSGWRSVFVASMIIAALIAVMAFLRLDGRGEPRRALSVGGTYRDYVLLLTGRRSLIVYGTVLCEGLFLFGVFPFVSAALSVRGEGGSLIAGLCIAAFALGGMIYGLTSHHVIDRLGPWRMIAAGGIIAGVCYAIAAAPVPWLALAALFAIAGYGFYLIHNTMQTYSTELSTQARGAAVALFALFYFAGQGLGPLMSGEIVAVSGFGAMFLVSAVLTAALGIVASRLLRRSQDGNFAAAG